MAAKKFTVIGSAPVPDPAAIPDGLGVHGQALWRDVQNEYAADDVGARETLFQICAAKDMAVRLRERIDRDGEVVKGRENSLIRQELAYRAFIVRGLQRLGLNLEPLRNAPGRPPGFP